jgi:hypothetical protein
LTQIARIGFFIVPLNPSSQISTEVAQQLGLQSHILLIGLSRLSCGNTTPSYLCQCFLSLAGMEHVPIVLTVSPGSSNVFGMDLIYRLKMEINFAKGEFYICPKDSEEATLFPHLNFHSMLTNQSIKESDLVNLETLPSPEAAFKELSNSRKCSTLTTLDKSPKNCCNHINLGVSFSL